MLQKNEAEDENVIPNAGGRSKNDRNRGGGRGRGEEEQQQQATAGKRVAAASCSEPRRFEGRVDGDRWICRISADFLTEFYLEGASPWQFLSRAARRHSSPVISSL